MDKCTIKIKGKVSVKDKLLENGIGRTLFKGIGIGKSKSTKKKK